MDSNSDTNNQSGIYKVRDPIRILKVMFVLLIFIGICYLLLPIYIEYITESSGDIFLQSADPHSDVVFFMYPMIVVVSITLLILLRLRAIWSGVKVNLDERYILIPGGNVSPNNIIDFLMPRFLLQHFLRFRINLSEIRQINQSQKTTTSSGMDGRIKTKTRYRLGISGSFGSANVWFIDEGKRNEIYAAIREFNRMGDPLIQA